MVMFKRSGNVLILGAAAAALAMGGASIRANITSGFDTPGNWVVNGTSAYTPLIAPFNGVGDLTLTTAQNGETTSAWYTTQQDVADSWTASFTYQISGANGNPADGFMFTVQNGGTTALGSGGGAKGFQDPASTGFTSVNPAFGLGFELFYQQASDLQIGYNANFVSGQSASTSPGTLNLATDTNPINFTINYYAPTQMATISAVDSTNPADSLSYNVYSVANSYSIVPNPNLNLSTVIGQNTGYVGFTGGTGGLNAEQDFTNFNFTSNPGAAAPPGTIPTIPAYIQTPRAPIALSSGSFNADNVVENSYAATTNGAIPTTVASTAGYVNTFYEAGLAVSGVVQGGGLPTSHQFVGETDNVTTFGLQHYTNTNNVLRLTSATGGTPSGTMTLVTPTAFTTLAILATSTNAGGNIGGTVTLNFTNGTSVTTDYAAPDWFAGSNGATADGNVYGVAFGGVSRIDVQNSSTSGLPNNPNLYETILNLASLGLEGGGTANVAGDTLASLTFNINSGIATTDIFAVSGSASPVPEPSQLLLAAAGCAGLLLLRRRMVHGR